MRLHFKGNNRLRLFFAVLIVLFLFKLFYYSADLFVLRFFNEVLVLLALSLLVLYLMDLLQDRKINPLSMVMNIGIINAVLFFLIIFSDSILTGIFGSVSDSVKQPGIAFSFISFIYLLINLGFLALIFLTFKELHFLKQKRNVSTYFNTMVVFFLLTSFSTVLNTFPGLKFFNSSFMVISVLLILINSIKISWIAFIVKKEKITLLILSVIISILFVVNLMNSSEGNAHNQIFSVFSPALDEFFNLMMIYGAIYFSILFFTTLFHIPTAEAFDRKAQEVTSLQNLSRLITQVFDFNDLAETVTELAKKVSNANASWIVWNDKEKQKTIAHHNIGFVDADLISGYSLKSVRGNIDQISIINLDHFEERHKLNENYMSVAIAPLKSHNEISGYLITAKKDDYIFDEEDKLAITTFSDYASVAIENSRLVKESIEKERLEKELDVAREIQRKILPASDPEFKNLSISSVFIPAFEVGGDYYDFFEIDSNRFAFVIADVSGKGISAAFIMAEVKGIFESLTRTSDSPKEILIKANQILKRTLDRKNFVSAAFGIIDFRTDSLSIARAGHCPIMLVHEKRVELIRPSGIGLGLNFGFQFENSLEEIKLDLNPGDMVVLYTDGITEAKNKMMEDFGDKYFTKILVENADKKVNEISNIVIREISLFTQDNTQHDDITLVILKWKEKIKTDGVEEWQNSTPQLKTKVM